MIGFIGLGIMGKPMVENLIEKGCAILINDIDQKKLKEVEQKGAKYASLQEIGKECDVIFTSLPKGSIVIDVLLGKNGVITTIKQGSIIADLSSITPKEAIICAEALKKRNAEFLDCPVSGGEPKAIDGTLAFMAGGSEKAFETIKPLLYFMGNSAVLIGSTGSGSVAKLSNQIIVNMTITAIAEAFVFAAKSNVDVNKVYEAIRGGLAASAVLDSKGPMMITRNFKPGGTIAVNMKDIKNVLDTAYDNDVPLPMTSLLLATMQSLKTLGHFNDDHSGIIQYYEKIANM